MRTSRFLILSFGRRIISFVRSCDQWLSDTVQVYILFPYQKQRILKDVQALNTSLVVCLFGVNELKLSHIITNRL